MTNPYPPNTINWHIEELEKKQADVVEDDIYGVYRTLEIELEAWKEIKAMVEARLDKIKPVAIPNFPTENSKFEGYLDEDFGRRDELTQLLGKAETAGSGPRQETEAISGSMSPTGRGFQKHQTGGGKQNKKVGRDER